MSSSDRDRTYNEGYKTIDWARLRETKRGTPWERAAISEDELLIGYGWSRHQCPGDGERGCGVVIPADRERCYFCTKTIRLRQEGHVIP